MGYKINLIFKKSFSRYLIVGLFCQLIDFVTTINTYMFFENIFFANLLGYSLGTLISYLLHTKFTFKFTSRNLFSFKQILLFSISCIIGSILGFIILKLMLLYNLDISLSKMIQLMIIAISQYLFNKKFTYKKY